MIELFRIIESQARLSSYRATKNEEQAAQLELMIEMTKPKDRFPDWNRLIATPFRYHPPHPSARFRPPYGKNVFYAAVIEETALYEHAYHFMRERMHLNLKTDVGTRTIFTVEADNRQSFDVSVHPNYKNIMSKIDYTASQDFISNHPDITFIIYPSCRDPKSRNNAAILDINLLSKNIAWEAPITFFYDNVKKQILWTEHNLHIKWSEIQ